MFTKGSLLHMKKETTYENDTLAKNMDLSQQAKFMFENALPQLQEYSKLMAYYRCAIMEIETKFNEGTTPKWTITKDGEPMTYVDNIFEFDVVNKTGATLPSTGGVGTTMLYIIGGIMVVAAIVLLVTKKRVDAEAK